jgi:hypothetical protein
MTQFPRLAGMTAVQYPLRRSQSFQRVECELPGGMVIVSSDAPPDRKKWTVQLRLLSDPERTALEDLFKGCRGRLGSFRWLDPASNLLKWSTAVDQVPWEHDAGVTTEGSMADPMGTTEGWRITNAAQTPGGIRQKLSIDPTQAYAGSCWARAATETEVQLRVGVAGGTATALSRAGQSWQRLTTAHSGEESLNQVEYSLALPPGGRIEIYGPQLENQPGAGGYRRTHDRAGVYSARFNQDHLSFTATGPGEYSTRFEVISISES